MQKTNIEYLTHSWNPLQDKRKGPSGRGYHCTKCSPACDHCWAEAVNMRFGNKLPFDDTTVEFEIVKNEILTWEIRATKKPARIGIQFMGDLFHPAVTNRHYGKIFDVVYMGRYEKLMKKREHPHIFMALTKRIERAAEVIEYWQERYGGKMPDNFWLGVSIWDQESANRFIPILLQIPAAVHFVSAEPVLEAVDISQTVTYWDDPSAGIKLVIAGCESGPGRRHIGVKPFRQLRDQCVAAYIPYFLKQMEIGGKVVKMPRLDSKVWAQMPEGK